MATEYFAVRYLSAKSVFVRFFDPTQSKTYDFNDSTWQTTPVNPKLPMVEKSSFADADESLYIASMELTDLYPGGTPRDIVAQALDDLATDVIISEEKVPVITGTAEAPPASTGTARLDAVNEMLEAVGERPVDELDTGGTSIEADAERVLDRLDLRIQEEGWYENTEDVELEPDVNDKIEVAATILRIDTRDSSEDMNVAVRAGYLYDLDDLTDEFGSTVYATIVRRLGFSDLSVQLQRLIIAEACSIFHKRKIANPSWAEYLDREAARARLICRKSELDRSDLNLGDTDEARQISGYRYPRSPVR